MTFVNGREEVEQEQFRKDTVGTFVMLGSKNQAVEEVIHESVAGLVLLGGKVSAAEEIIAEAVKGLVLLGNTKAVKGALIVTADATDLASALVLLNEIKGAFNLMNA